MSKALRNIPIECNTHGHESRVNCCRLLPQTSTDRNQMIFHLRSIRCLATRRPDIDHDQFLVSTDPVDFDEVKPLWNCRWF